MGLRAEIAPPYRDEACRDVIIHKGHEFYLTVNKLQVYKWPSLRLIAILVGYIDIIQEISYK